MNLHFYYYFFFGKKDDLVVKNPLFISHRSMSFDDSLDCKFIFCVIYLDYEIDRPSGRNYCVDTVLYGPICMCNKYRGRELGFCVPQLHKSAGFRLVQNAYTALLKTGKSGIMN